MVGWLGKGRGQKVREFAIGGRGFGGGGKPLDDNQQKPKTR